MSPPMPAHLAWLDRLKGTALLWVILSHVVEPLFGFPAFGNPGTRWPALRERVAQLAPMSGHGWLDIPANLVRWVGWLGDAGVSIFLIATGFGLTWGLAASGARRLDVAAFYRRRLLRLYPAWLVVHAVLAVFVFTQVIRTSRLHFLLSAAGVRFLPNDVYAIVPAWWFVSLLIQIYAVFPILYFILRRSRRAFILVTAAAVVVRGMGLLALDSYLDPWSRGAVFVTRLPDVAFGMGLAWVLFHDHERVEARLRSLPWSAGGLAIALVGFALSFTLAGMTLAPVLLGGGVVLASYGLLAGEQPSRLLGGLAWFGRHSYSIYLVHGAAVAFALPYGRSSPRSLDTWEHVALAIVATVIGCWLLEHATDGLERLVRHRGDGRQFGT
jgi:peptidoglycan/LPS O-acetylase OafA/YrhL